MRGHYPKAYLRIDPNLDHTHPEPGAFVRLLCAAARQPKRGRFKAWALVERALGRAQARKHRDVWHDIKEDHGAWIVDGWDNWQEGDHTVQERMRRYRERHSSVTGAVTRTVTSPSHERGLVEPSSLLPPTPPNNPPPGVGQQAPERNGAAAAKGPTNGHSDHGLSKSFLTRDAHRATIADAERLLDALMERQPDQDRAWLLRQHSTVKGSGAYIVRLDTAKHEHLVRTVQSLRDAVEKLRGAASGEREGLLTLAEHERRRQG